MDFMEWWHAESHFLDDMYDEETRPFVGAITHAHLSTDILALISLLSNSLHHQANALMRRTIEYVLFSVWLDIVSRIKGSFDYYWRPEWKRYYKHQRMNDEDIEERIDQIYDLNTKESESRDEFRKRFFTEASDLDYLRILSRIICEGCAETKENLAVSGLLVPEYLEEAIAEDEAVSNFQYPHECEYCGSEEKILGEVVHFPEISLIHEFLKREFDDAVLKSLSDIGKVYGRLSDHFVHFSPLASNANDEVIFKIGGKEVNLYGFEGAVYMFRKLSFILCNYYMILKNDFTVREYPGTCKAYNKNFESFK